MFQAESKERYRKYAAKSIASHQAPVCADMTQLQEGFLVVFILCRGMAKKNWFAAS